MINSVSVSGYYSCCQDDQPTLCQDVRRHSCQTSLMSDVTHVKTTSQPTYGIYNTLHECTSSHRESAGGRAVCFGCRYQALARRAAGASRQPEAGPIALASSPRLGARKKPRLSPHDGPGAGPAFRRISCTASAAVKPPRGPLGRSTPTFPPPTHPSARAQAWHDSDRVEGPAGTQIVSDRLRAETRIGSRAAARKRRRERRGAFSGPENERAGRARRPAGVQRKRAVAQAPPAAGAARRRSRSPALNASARA